MSDELLTQKLDGDEARELLNNRHFKAAFAAVEDYLNQKALSCDTNSKDFSQFAERVVLSKQLLASIKREIERKVENGEMAQIMMADLEKKKGLFQFRR